MLHLPKKPKFKGDFRKLSKVALSPEAKTLRFTPQKPGTATLSIHDKRGRKVVDYFITVRKSRLDNIAREIKALLVDIEGIEIKIINDRVVVDGQILLPRDLNRIYTVVKQYGNQASTLVTLSPLAQKKIAEFIERDINDPQVYVRAVNGKFLLEGTVDSPGEKQRAEIIAKTYIPDIIKTPAESDKLIEKVIVLPVINLIDVRPAPPPEPGKIVQLVVHYVELQKDYTKGFRFQWTPGIADKSNFTFSSGSRETAGGIISSITGTVSNLLPKLNWAKEHGYARVLQSSSVIVQDGQPGKIKSTTRIPYQVIGPGGQPSTQFEEAGIDTNITPKLVSRGSDSVQLDVNFAIKALLGMTETGPLVSNNAVQTVVIVRSGQSAAVGGLVSSSSGTDYNKLPKDGSADNPLFSLYASKSFRRNKSQFVVFITPIIKSSASAGSEKIKQKFRLRD